MSEFTIISLPDYDYWALFKGNDRILSMYADCQEFFNYAIFGYRIGAKEDIPKDIHTIEYQGKVQEICWETKLDKFQEKLEQMGFEVSYESQPS